MDKIFVFDIDGVLIPSGRSVGGNASVDPLLANLLRSKKWTVATGRGYLRVPPVLGSVWPTIPLICEGVKLYSSTTGEVLFAPRFSSEELATIGQLIHPERMSFVAFCSNQAKDGNKYFFWVRDNSALQYVQTKLASIFAAATEDQRVFERWLRQKQGSKVSFPASDGISLNGLNWTKNESIVDIYPDGFNKGSSVRRLCRHLDAEVKKVVVFVNDHNDIEMAEVVATGGGQVVVVGDNVPALTTLATIKIDSLEKVADVVESMTI